MLTQPRPFQVEGVKAIEKFGGRALLADEMGLGKSLQFLLFVERNMPAGQTAVVCCPAGIKYNWAKEAMLHCGIEAQIGETLICPGTFWKRPRLMVVNYNILEAWLPYLLKLQPWGVALDEAQMLKNWETVRTVSATRLCRNVPKVVAMTGTPVVNRPSDLWAVLHILNPPYWGAYYPFAHRYCGPRKGYRGRWVFDGVSNEEELHGRLNATCLIRRRKVDVLKDLPQRLHNPVRLAVGSKAMKEYRAAETSLREWLRRSVFVKGGHLYGDVLGGQNKTMLLKQLVASIKLEAVADWVENFLDGGERLLLFCHHRAMVTALAKRFKGCAVVNGDVVGRKRQEEYDRFNNGGTPLLVGNMDACGTGWSARGCSNVAVAEYPWRPDTLLQAIDRCHGMYRGVDGVPTTAHYLSVAGTIEEDVCQRLLDKQAISDKVVDGINNRGQLQVLEQVIRGLLEK